MKMPRISDWVLVALGIAFVAGGIVGNLTATAYNEQIESEILRLESDIEAQGEFIANLQMEVEATTAAANWMLEKIDKRRILIPVLNGDVYKIVEVEGDFKRKDETTDE